MNAIAVHVRTADGEVFTAKIKNMKELNQEIEKRNKIIKENQELHIKRNGNFALIKDFNELINGDMIFLAEKTSHRMVGTIRNIDKINRNKDRR